MAAGRIYDDPASWHGSRDLPLCVAVAVLSGHRARESSGEPDSSRGEETSPGFVVFRDAKKNLWQGPVLDDYRTHPIFLTGTIPFCKGTPQRPSKVTTMIDDSLALIRTRRNNIHRYRRLLRTELTDLEREFVERRISEEEAALQAFANSIFPLSFKLPAPKTAGASPA
jgi:hypothetical protein